MLESNSYRDNFVFEVISLLPDETTKGIVVLCGRDCKGDRVVSLPDDYFDSKLKSYAKTIFPEGRVVEIKRMSSELQVRRFSEHQ